MPTRKRRTREHVIADLAVNHVERLVLRNGWVVRRIIPDYGVDMSMETFDAEGMVENGMVFFQVKATDSPRRTAKGLAIAVRLDWRDILYWLNEHQPVILVIYDAMEDQAWWLHVQPAVRAESLKRRSRFAKSLTVHVPVANILTEECMGDIAALRDAQRDAFEDSLP